MAQVAIVMNAEFYPCFHALILILVVCFDVDFCFHIDSIGLSAPCMMVFVIVTFVLVAL